MRPAHSIPSWLKAIPPVLLDRVPSTMPRLVTMLRMPPCCLTVSPLRSIGLAAVGPCMRFVSTVVRLSARLPVAAPKQRCVVVLILQVLLLQQVRPRQCLRTLLPSSPLLKVTVQCSLRTPCEQACLQVVVRVLPLPLVMVPLTRVSPMHRRASAELFRAPLSDACISVCSALCRLRGLRLQNCRLLIETRVRCTNGETLVSVMQIWPLLQKPASIELLFTSMAEFLVRGGALILRGTFRTVIVSTPVSLVVILVAGIVRFVTRMLLRMSMKRNTKVVQSSCLMDGVCTINRACDEVCFVS